MDNNSGYYLVPGSLRYTAKKKYPGIAAFLLIFIITLLLPALTPGRLAGETEKKNEKKKQTQSSQTAESKKKLEPKTKAKPLPKSEPVSKSEHKQYKRTIIAGEPKKYTGEPGNFIFHEADKRPYSVRQIQRIVADIGLRAGIKKLHPHMLRHSLARWMLIEGGYTPQVVQVVMRHASYKTTVDNYGNLDISDVEKIIDAGDRRPLMDY